VERDSDKTRSLRTARDFRLTRELADQIVFGMENQDHEFYLDLDSQTVVPEPPDLSDDSERYVGLPPWRSVDGYNLMERFVASLRNPIYRERLRAILASGRGVFRQFKQALAERDDIERLWFAFKQREMRGLVSEWVNDLRELRGLDRLELSEDEETLPLIASDFVISPGGASHVQIVRKLDRESFAETHDGDSPALVDLLYDFHRRGELDPESPDSEILVAETPAQDLAGFVWSVRLRSGAAVVSVVAQIYVIPEYRGLGLASALLRDHLLRCHQQGYTEAVLELSGSNGEFEEHLTELGFGRESGAVRIRIDHWFRKNEGA